MWLDRVLARQASLRPDDVALKDARRELTWRRLRQEVHALARSLADRLPAGERAVVLSDNRVEVLETYLACAAASVVVVPVNTGLADAEIEFILDYIEPRLAIAEEPYRKRLAALAPELPRLPIEEIGPAVDADDARVFVRPPALGDPFGILHTSATTGHPKGAVVSHRSLQANALSWLVDVRPPERTIYLNASPLFHGSMVIALDYLAAGGTVCVLDRFTPQGCLAAIAEWRVEHVLMVPSMIRLLQQTKALGTADLDSLSLIMHTAEPMPAILAERARATLGVPLLNVYGITEGGGPVVTCGPSAPAGPARIPGATCVGIPMAGVDARVRVDGRVAEIGEVGEICLHGDGIMDGYWRRPEATEQAIEDGWLRTGDLGYREADGRLWVVDRRTDLILRGGQNVYPAEIERVLRVASWVAEAAVVAAPSATWGQTPWAFVVPASPDLFDEQELLDLAVRELASFKRPSRFVPVERLPRSPTGKLLRRVLRDEAARLTATEGTP